MKLNLTKPLCTAILVCAAHSVFAETLPTHPCIQDSILPDYQEKGKPVLNDIVGDKLASQNYAHMELQFNTSGQVHFDNGKYSSGNFTINGVKMQISGELTDGLGYMFRQSFTKRYDVNSTDNVSMALEKAYVTWDVTKHLQLAFGKQYMEIGGYEYWQTSNRIRFYSDFNSTVRCAQTGITAYMKMAPGHTLALQLLNNSCASESSTYDYGFPETLKKTKTPLLAILGYRGFFADGAFALHYGAGYGQLANNRQQTYITAGHVYKRGPVLAYLDVMYAREGIDTKGIISGYSANYDADGLEPWAHTAQNVEYLSFIANIDYRLSPHFNAYIKGISESGRVYRDNGIYQKGRYNNTWSMQACVEYFPITTRDLRFFLHGVYKKTDLTKLGRLLGSDSNDTMRLSVGLEYVLPVF